MTLYLVGQGHFDTKAPQRVETLIRRITPEAISLELTRKDYIQGVAQGSIIENLSKEALKDKIVTAFPQFDPDVAYAIVQKLRKDLVIDRLASELDARLIFAESQEAIESDPQLSARIENATPATLLRQIPELKKTLAEFERDIEREYALPHYPVSDLPNYQAWLSTRDEFAEEQIREPFERNGDITLVHFGGLDHLFGDYHNLAWRLRDLHPIVLKLNQAETHPLRNA